MDPNAALAELRTFLRQWEASAREQRPIEEYDRAIELARDLDEWLSRGGFLPAEWDHAYHAPR
jgi:hypothetical protein